MRGLKPDAKVFDELVFDVNSAYFENHGGYEYAKEFFAEAYKLAVKEAGSEEYILSAVLHADERNKALSDQYGRDIFHYHLHVVYIPVADKEIRWSKRCKDPKLTGTAKEVIKQVSHSKKRPRFRDDNGHWVNCYSLLQDRFYEHMKESGFTDFERGERGSTAEHLSVLEYKTKQESERASAFAAVCDERSETAVRLDKKVEKSRERLNSLKEKISVSTHDAFTFAEIEGMAKRTVLGKIELSPADWKMVSGLAKESIVSRGAAKDLKHQLSESRKEMQSLKNAFDRMYEETGIFRKAMKTAPNRAIEGLQVIISQNRERRGNNSQIRRDYER